ncbi:MAG: YceD family protein [Solirubrobacteraceae bacterium]
MVARTDTFDLGRLQLSSGEGRRLSLGIALGTMDFAGQAYAIEPALLEGTLDVSRMTHGGYALRLRFDAALHGPCMRCLEPAEPVTHVDVREVHQENGGDELTSPYVQGEDLDLEAWARDALALALPAQVLCRRDCAGLCPRCGANFNEDPGHEHEAEPDPRWAKLRELKLD